MLRFQHPGAAEAQHGIGGACGVGLRRRNPSKTRTNIGPQPKCAGETGKKWAVQVRCDEGAANRIDPEPCTGSREAAGEALTGGTPWPAVAPRAHSYDEPRMEQSRMPTSFGLLAGALGHAAHGGGVISPLLSTIYLTEVDRMLERAKEVGRATASTPPSKRRVLLTIW